ADFSALVGCHPPILAETSCAVAVEAWRLSVCDARRWAGYRGGCAVRDRARARPCGPAAHTSLFARLPDDAPAAVPVEREGDRSEGSRTCEGCGADGTFRGARAQDVRVQAYMDVLAA